MPNMPELQRLRADHASAILAFEQGNRGYFAGFISDRGDDYFDKFTEKYQASLELQDTRLDAYYALVAEDGSVIGRFNLVNIKDGQAELGYRVAQHAAGRGVATAAVQELCRLAATEHGVRVLKARTSHQNVASQRVLTKAGFVPAGEAEINGRPAAGFERTLTAERPGAM